MNVQIIKTPAGEEMAILPKAEYDALVAAANDAIEDAADAAAYDAAMAKLDPENILPAEVSAFITRGDSRLRAIRKWRGQGQVAVAATAGITQGHLSDIESGRRSLTPALAERLAHLLNVPAAWLAP